MTFAGMRRGLVELRRGGSEAGVSWFSGYWIRRRIEWPMPRWLDNSAVGILKGIRFCSGFSICFRIREGYGLKLLLPSPIYDECTGTGALLFLFRIEINSIMAKRIYFRHPSKQDVVSVPTGFSWLAALLGFIWAANRKLWLLALVLFVVDVAIGFASMINGTVDLIATVASIGFAVYCGVAANRWHCRILERKGWVRV
ncbi:DUF2628 domain-containing protein [Burkholderia sp. 22PA0106]|uniref:DUF2628 domain-containing protein n=1 Tax=Burkholderia sp. 22PA0106 TaxID=3237371 RepID=UPI0039C387BC